jgi:ribonuclease VapC
LKYVLDASAVLALLNEEEGAEIVEARLAESSISAVNLVEVGTRLSDAGMPEADIAETLLLLDLNVIAFDREAAMLAMNLRRQTKHAGLSLGDRACLALAASLPAIALTSDRAWSDLDAGCEIQLIR